MNSGSLLRRTVLHIAVFVIGTAAFLALASFVLTTVLKSVVSPDKGTSAAEGEEEATAASVGPKPAKPPRKKRGPAPAPAPTAEDE